MASELLRIRNCDGELCDVEVSDWTGQRSPSTATPRPESEAPLFLSQFGPSLRPDHEAEAERQKALAELRERLRPSQ